jgi:plastocyanin
MRKSLALLIFCLALGVVVAGCGGDDEGGSGGGQEEQQPAEGGGGGGEAVAVSMRDIKFDPEEVTVAAGDTVEWTNEESTSHDVDGSGPGGEFSSGPEGGMGQGDRFRFTFEEPGAYEYVCRVHAPGMAGTVRVE